MGSSMMESPIVRFLPAGTESEGCTSQKAAKAGAAPARSPI